MQAEMPFYESPEDALKACVGALGGAKAVGSALFPDKTIDNARDYLLACLNHDRPEKLSVSQVMFIFREAKAAGFHSGFTYFAGECQYAVTPIDQEDEKLRLQRDYISAVQHISKLTEKLQAAGLLKAVA